MPKEKKQNLHQGHRQRVKERFLKHGLESFTDIQLLETLLFYAVPKKDTNDTAHLLLNEFGSFKKVLEADYETLIKIKGIGENAASLIKFFQMASKRYLELTYAEKEEKTYNSSDELTEYCKRLFLGESKEMFYVLALDCELTILEKALINDGSPNKVYIPYRKITDFVHKAGVNRIVLTHNHPIGVCSASKDDIIATKEIVELMSQIEVEVIDHIIVGKKGASSMKNSNSASDIWGLKY